MFRLTREPLTAQNSQSIDSARYQCKYLLDIAKWLAFNVGYVCLHYFVIISALHIHKMLYHYDVGIHSNWNRHSSPSQPIFSFEIFLIVEPSASYSHSSMTWAIFKMNKWIVEQTSATLLNIASHIVRFEWFFFPQSSHKVFVSIFFLVPFTSIFVRIGAWNNTTRKTINVCLWYFSVAFSTLCSVSDSWSHVTYLFFTIIFGGSVFRNYKHWNVALWNKKLQ